MSRQFALLLRGLPGTGKTTTAALLRNALNPAVRVSNDSVRYMAQPRDFAAFTLDASERACFDLALSYHDSGFTPIVDGVFEDVETLISEELRFARRGCKLVIVSFTAEMSDLIERNDLRHPLQRMDESRLAKLQASFRNAGYALSIGGKMPEEVCEDVLDVIEERRSQWQEPPVRPEEVDVLFLRHGTPEHPEGIYADPFAMGLSPCGRAEARAARHAVLRFAPDAVFSSDFARAIETAELAIAGTKREIEISKALRERVFLQLVGKEFTAIRAELDAEAEGILTGNSDLAQLPGEERYAEARARVLDFFGSLPGRFGGKRVLVVAHDGPHQWLVEQALGVDLQGVRRYRWDAGSFSRFTVSPSQIRLEGMNIGPSAVVSGLETGAV
ncbi:histidine phosphatase family protein [Solwaraspora sp. WMMA2065]|uniref:histidine phosphatase family protein n=1 Tax=Solwaraspora sp. WMMA2065 TaxID=3015166 RepID=UPI00259AEE9A|nr:histidine phosphatase family protein [Solwaraspora sp. WMMA2065]WJK33728.1 histidine phosphatase family protein [Solwaraspora sp. WMMA2065]